MSKRFSRRSLYLVVPCMLIVALAVILNAQGAFAGHTPPGTYVNPVSIDIPNSAIDVESFADPAVIRANDGYYYAYATTDPLNDQDRQPNGDFNFHKIPMARSTDLVHWTYIGDAFTANPSWMAPTGGIWAPDVRYMNGLYYMYFTATDTADEVSGEPNCGGDSAIGVATSPNPYGPWTDTGRPVVYPRRAGGGCNFFWTFDPALISDDIGQLYIYFGSYYGGIKGRLLSKDGTTSDPATEVPITIANRYEGAYVVRHEGFYYLFASATDCCRGPLSGYSVFAGRSADPLGPYVDKNGVSLLDGRVGGSPVISMNGNKWMGPGHNAVLTDMAGQDWFFYHAIDRNDPYFDPPNPFNINKRPMLMDRLDWINGWPTVRAEYWASDSPQPAPAATASATPQPTPERKPIDVPGTILEGPSDEFNGTLEPQWSWVRQPPPTEYSLTERPGYFRFRTQSGDLFEDSNNAPVLVMPAPAGDFLVETKFDFDLPPEGCCFNYQQAGMVLYQDDNAFLKLAHFSLWETRQTEWAKEVPPGSGPRYGNTVIGPPGQPDVLTTTTWLRIAKQTDPNTGQQYYTGYNSFNGINWYRGATWTHNLSNIQIGLISMGRNPADPQHTADFDYVRVYTLAPRNTATATAVATGTSTVMPSMTSTVMATASGTSTSMPSMTSTTLPSMTSTVMPSMTSTIMATSTPTVAPSMTSTATVVPSMTATTMASATSTIAPSMTRTSTVVASRTVSATVTPCSGRVTICHRTGNGEAHTITVSCNALPAHLAHGDTVGACPVSTPGQRGRFSDVNSGDFFYEYVLDLSDRGAVGGYSDGTFRPYNNTTRAQLVKIVVLAFAMPLYSGTDQSFTDVPTDHPFYLYIETAQRNGTVGGYSDGTFRPYNNVTRGQIAKIAVEASSMADATNGNSTQTFSDVPVGSTFYNYIETAYANGILSGYADGTFRPNNDATRGQVAKIVDLATSASNLR